MTCFYRQFLSEAVNVKMLLTKSGIK